MLLQMVPRPICCLGSHPVLSHLGVFSLRSPGSQVQKGAATSFHPRAVTEHGKACLGLGARRGGGWHCEDPLLLAAAPTDWRGRGEESDGGLSSALHRATQNHKQPVAAAHNRRLEGPRTGLSVLFIYFLLLWLEFMALHMVTSTLPLCYPPAQSWPSLKCK